MYEEPFEGTLFNGLPINNKYPMSERYLESAHLVYRDALTRYSKILMFHVTLRFPLYYEGRCSGVMSAFIRSLKKRVERDLARRRLKVERVHNTDVHYVWCREVSREYREHYHIMVMVNANTYRALGCYTKTSNEHLAGMVTRSWASAIGMSIDDIRGLVHFTDDVGLIATRQIPYTSVESTYGTFNNSFEAGFYWLSYLCKLITKEYGNGARNFGYSQTCP
ncbi:hypothetical protein BTR40_10140 [Vibrio parahaemolyticus]|uniref:inovirus Gp2 family protein n=1 Tax=Vibrio parahaemolyticus TaxID=670 RepID=UPI000A38E1C3|nr:inovirus Gp2 family protein [Vibrio parahaemolyticus]OUJ36261.1 hypothetical protein BTR40_10140 [Vibrio parahaemolyticus]